MLLSAPVKRVSVSRMRDLKKNKNNNNRIFLLTLNKASNIREKFKLKKILYILV